MAYEFTENEHEFEPQASSARGGSPPRKVTGAGVLDPPFPPKRPSSLFFRILSGLLLAALAAAILFLLFAKR